MTFDIYLLEAGSSDKAYQFGPWYLTINADKDDLSTGEVWFGKGCTSPLIGCVCREYKSRGWKGLPRPGGCG